MRWEPGALAGFLAAPRLNGEQLAEGVAVALAATGGDDAYEATAGRPLLWDRRGPWAIDVVAYPWAGMLNLADPRIAAAAARDLWHDAGDSWAWSPVHGTAAWRIELHDARAAVASSDRNQYPRFDTEPTMLLGARLAVQQSAVAGFVLRRSATALRLGSRP